jgi:tRNA-specific 2-thiouridylase
VDADGARLGSHDGHWRFTPGQRRGLRLSAARPLYVLRTDAATNTVVVGSRDELATTRVEACGRLYRPVHACEAKLRYRSAPVPATVTARGDGFVLHLDDPVFGVAPGQFAVLYEDDAVVGAGAIANIA